MSFCIRSMSIFSLCLMLSISPVFVSQSFADDGGDKALHVGASFVISTLSYNFYKSQFNMSDTKARLAAFVTTIAIGAVKEATDDEFSGSDMGANAGGAGLGVLVGFEF